VNDETSSPALYNKDADKLQQLTGTLLYYARAVDPTLIIPINVLASEQSKATEVTADKVIKLLNYCNTHPETKIRYHASDMILHIHIDASYLSENEAKSRAGGILLHGQRHKNRQKTYKRCDFNHQQGAKKRNVLRSRSRNWGSFYKRQIRSSP
jgi:hypothetical protein